MTDGGDWEGLVDAMQHAAKVVLDDPRVDSPLSNLEGVRYLTRLVAAGSLFELENQDPAYPHFTRMESPWMQWGLPNPDTAYLSAYLHGDHSYRIVGKRGSAHLLAIEVYSSRWSRMGEMHLVDSVIHLVDGRGELEVGPDGSFEIVLSREKQEGNWLALPAGEACLMVRSVYYDWETEEPGMVVIEREGATYPPPPATEDQLSERIGRVAEFLRVVPTVMIRGIDQAYAAEEGTVQFPPMTVGTDHNIGFRQQNYGQGIYRCAPGEAVVVEVTPPNCVYWAFHLSNHFWESLDWNMRQNSINGHQAVLDPDGVFRAVISHEDPGVPNWLDASGHPVGLISVRYNSADSVPIPRSTVMALDQLRDAIHPDTPEVAPAERAESIRRRMLSVRRRLAD